MAYISGDIYMSPNGNCHLFVNGEEYVHIVSGGMGGGKKREYGIHRDYKNIRGYPGGIVDWVYICNIGKLLCDILEYEECKPECEPLILNRLNKL